MRTGALVTDVTPEAVRAGDEVIPTRTVLWAAGVQASPLVGTLGVPLDRSGRVPVEPELTIPGHPEAYVVGDLAAFAHQTGKPLPGVAPLAIQQGRAAAENIGRTIRGEPRRPFRYADRGSMATIGRGAGVADLRYVHLAGLAGWLAWLVVHLYFLIGFENRLLVLAQWAWSFFTHQRGARLIAERWSPRAGRQEWADAEAVDAPVP